MKGGGSSNLPCAAARQRTATGAARRRTTATPARRSCQRGSGTAFAGGALRAYIGPSGSDLRRSRLSAPRARRARACSCVTAGTSRFCIDMQSYRIDMQSYRIDMQSYRIDMQSYRIDMQSYRIDMQSYRIDLQSYRIDMQSYRIEVQSYRIDLQWYRIDLQWYRIDLQTYCIDLQHVRPGKPCAGEETVAGGEGEPRLAGLVRQAVPGGQARRRRRRCDGFAILHATSRARSVPRPLPGAARGAPTSGRRAPGEAWASQAARAARSSVGRFDAAEDSRRAGAACSTGRREGTPRGRRGRGLPYHPRELARRTAASPRSGSDRRRPSRRGGPGRAPLPFPPGSGPGGPREEAHIAAQGGRGGGRWAGTRRGRPGREGAPGGRRGEGSHITRGIERRRVRGGRGGEVSLDLRDARRIVSRPGRRGAWPLRCARRSSSAPGRGARRPRRP